MLNYIWLTLVILAVLLGGYFGRLDDVVKGGFDMCFKPFATRLNFQLQIQKLIQCQPLSCNFRVLHDPFVLADNNGDRIMGGLDECKGIV